MGAFFLLDIQRHADMKKMRSKEEKTNLVSVVDADLLLDRLADALFDCWLRDLERTEKQHAAQK